MDNINEDTEWNDILRSRGIIPAKKEKEFSEDEIVNIVENVVDLHRKKFEKDSDTNSVDSEDEEFLQEYRKKRISEMKEEMLRKKFGEVMEISGQDYVREVNNAGPGVWVVLHLYRQGIPLCALINHYMKVLSEKYPFTKFIKSIASTCIANFPDDNLPSVFIYFENKLKQKYVGPLELRSPKLSEDEFEYLIGKSGAIKTDVVDDPRQGIRNNLFYDLKRR